MLARASEKNIISSAGAERVMVFNGLLIFMDRLFFFVTWGASQALRKKGSA